MLFCESYEGELKEFYGDSIEVSSRFNELFPSLNYDVSNWRDDQWMEEHDWEGYTLMVSLALQESMTETLEFLRTTKLSITIFDVNYKAPEMDLSTVPTGGMSQDDIDNLLAKVSTPNATISDEEPNVEEVIEDIKRPAEVKEETTGLSKSVLAVLKMVEKKTGIKFQTFEGGKAIKYKNVISTGLMELDYWVFGVGGIIPGRIYEWFGPEGSGKTTLCHVLNGSSQRVHADNPNSFSLLIDVENAFDPFRAEVLGVNLKRLVVIQPNVVDNASDALKLLLDEVVAGSIYLTSVTWDSIAAIQTAREFAQEAATGEMMGRALFVSKFLRQITGRLSDAKCPMFFINQVRDNITSMGARGYSTPGGRSLKHGASVRIEVKRVEFLGSEDNRIGQVIQIKTLKNRFTPPFRSCEINLYFEGRPFRAEESLMSFAIKMGIIKRTGGTHKYKEEKLASSRANMFERIDNMINGDDAELAKVFESIKEDVRKDYLSDGPEIEDDGGDIEKFDKLLEAEMAKGSLPLEDDEARDYGLKNTGGSDEESL